MQSHRESEHQPSAGSESIREQLIALHAGDDREREDQLRHLLAEYERFIATNTVDAKVEVASDGRTVDPGEVDEARGHIRTLVAVGVRPIVSVPTTGLHDVLARGLQAKDTWIPGFRVIAGTFGVAPYLPEHSPPRTLIEVDAPPEDIEPRFTGKEQSYHGVVTLKPDRIPPDRLRIIALE